MIVDRVLLEGTSYYYENEDKKILGKGAFGKVYLGGKFFTNEVYAVKELAITDL
jgi:serine/threonine protein kinase